MPHHELQAVEVSVAFRKVARKGVPKDVLLPVFKACCAPDLPPLPDPVARADALLGGAAVRLFQDGAQGRADGDVPPASCFAVPCRYDDFAFVQVDVAPV